MTEMKISIITVTYNSQSYLEKTIQSVIGQDYSDIEYIIIDGGSTDRTLEIIERYKSHISYFLSEPDKNMYDAINKGLKVATGDYIAILNSDDYYADLSVISNIVYKIDKYKKWFPGGIYGNLIKVSADGSPIRRRRGFQVSFKQLLLSKKLSFVGHATLFISRKCIEQTGLYNSENYNFAGDYDYVLRCFRNWRFKYVNLNIFNFRNHESSITSSGKIQLENEFVLKNNGYYNYSLPIRVITYYYVWMKFLILNFRYLLNRI